MWPLLYVPLTAQILELYLYVQVQVQVQVQVLGIRLVRGCGKREESRSLCLYWLTCSCPCTCLLILYPSFFFLFFHRAFGSPCFSLYATVLATCYLKNCTVLYCTVPYHGTVSSSTFFRRIQYCSETLSRALSNSTVELSPTSPRNTNINTIIVIFCNTLSLSHSEVLPAWSTLWI